MNTDNKTMEPEELPSGLETAIGEIRGTEKQCPGVFYVSTRGNGRQTGREFYVIAKNADSISAEAKRYGLEVPECPQYLIYPMDQARQVRRIIEYEVQLFRMKQNPETADRRSLRETALYGMEDCPEYFGLYPVPIQTPYGYTVRYKTLMNGVFRIETDRCLTVLAVSFPIWEDLFSRYIIKLANCENVHSDKDGFGYLYFPDKAVCPAIFELGRTYRELRDSPVINYDALMNAIWADFPDYAISFNTLEQSGGCNVTGCSIPDDTATISVDRMIRMTPNAGTDYLRF